MSEERRPLTAEEKEECAALKREFLAWNAPLPRKDRISQEKMAAHLKMNQGSFSNYLNGHRPVHIGIAVGVYELMGIPVDRYSPRLAAEIARLGKTGSLKEDNQGQESNVISADFSSKGKLKDGELSIPQYNVRGALGHGQVPADYIETIRHVTVHESLLSGRGISFSKAENLAIITGFGQSMEGTINDGDPLIVDRGINQFIGDGIYVLTWDGLLYVKRLQKHSPTHFDMISDNPRHKDQTISIADVTIHARVLLVWNAKKL
ncbi:MAG: S24 family peptidase [Halopseudomonas sp.]|uniref:S24 family peptidase n=1 Tax=Halopseudomonas sp. TaxID=2901191 RepID=UPI003001468E